MLYECAGHTGPKNSDTDISVGLLSFFSEF